METRAQRILLSETDDRLFSAFKDTLEDAGYEVLGALSMGEEAVPLPRRHLDAAVVSGNVHHPGFQRLASELAERSVPTLFIAAEIGAEHFPMPSQRLQKPFTAQRFLAALDETLRAGREAA